MLRILPRIFYVFIYIFFYIFFWTKNLKKSENPKNVKKCQKWDENIKDARRNSEHFRRIQTFWGPLFDHFPGFNNFVKIGVPGSIPHVFSFLGFSGAAQSFFRGKNRPFPKLNRGTLDFYHFLTIFDDFL